TTFTVQTLLDAALGPGKPGAVGVANSAAGDVVGLPKSIKPKFAKAGGALSAVYTYKCDNDEIDEAKKIVEKVKEKIKSVEKTIKTVEDLLGNDVDKLEKMQDAFQKALDKAQSEAGKYKSAENSRLALLKELKDLN